MGASRSLRPWAAVAALALAFGGWAAALEVRVDPQGGPLVLVDQVDAALADWRAAGVDVDAVARTVTVRYGDPARLGPDAIALVVVRPDEGGFEVLVHPEADGVRAALIPALGVVLGGVLGDGALNPRVDPAAPAVPTAADAAALASRRPAVPGDVDGDGRVGFEDLLLVAAAYGRQGVNLVEDLDGDGVVGDADLEVLRAAYAFDEGSTPTTPEATPDDAPPPAEGDGEGGEDGGAAEGASAPDGASTTDGTEPPAGAP